MTMIITTGAAEEAVRSSEALAEASEGEAAVSAEAASEAVPAEEGEQVPASKLIDLKSDYQTQ